MKRLKDTGVGSTNGGSDLGIQGASTQDHGPDQERAILQVAEQCRITEIRGTPPNNAGY